MGSKRAWFARWTGGASIGQRGDRTYIMIDTRLAEGAPASCVERPVTLRLTPRRAEELSRELSSRARRAVRKDVEAGLTPPVRLADWERISEVDRIRRNYAEMTEVDHDPVIDGLSHLLADLIKVAERHGLDPEEVIDKAREHATGITDFKTYHYVDRDND